jgi:hypothetical protein
VTIKFILSLSRRSSFDQRTRSHMSGDATNQDLRLLCGTTRLKTHESGIVPKYYLVCRRSSVTRLPSEFLKVTLAALLLSCFARIVSAQQPAPPQALVTLSEPVPATLYPEAICAHCIVPEWDLSYLVHREFDKDPAMVTMYDRNGKKALEARIVLQDAARVSLLTAGATHAGGILVAGGAIFTDGSNQRFIAKTDPAGRTVQSVHMGRFTTHHVCEVPDGTVWALGFNMDTHDSPDAGKNVLRHYSFEKGLLGTFVSLVSISKSPESYLAIGSYLRCGKDRVSVYLGGPTAQYIEVDASTEKFTSWSVDTSSAVGPKTQGFAVTDEGKIFVAFADDPGPNGERKHGLYELKATPSSSIATLEFVDGTVTAFDSYATEPDGTFLRLWGADGNSLVVSRKGEQWGLSWAKVLTASMVPE